MTEQPMSLKELAKISPAAAIGMLFNAATEQYPERPNHPDFWAMARILTEMDDAAETRGAHIVWQEDGIDIDSLGYVANQRWKRAQELIGDPEASERERAVILWLDAFIAGLRFMRERTPTITQLLDESIDGSHRGGGRG